MSSIKIIATAPHVIQDDKGTPMYMGYVYTVKDTPRIQQFISEGFAAEVKAEEVETPEVSAPSKKPTKTLKDQETDSLT